ncbi:hypothetical protein GU243_20765 [Pseudarthrobacter psychrotolerans]|uniref:DUF6318 domain-containing protein n=1 Tax=Pseudarthrobacter psychrotolerans TaxID=2697569 RepID=A0A6P1NM46_9MICC|nr:DUF6318 family protein [Pseudarthrobacter psychrotolerans]QHK21715.1 hypothetical protein GU243_20765 [Pseudarthrobacter psychrotolerans]
MTSQITSTARRSRMHLVAAVAASALLLTGCNSGGDPNSGGTSSASPSASSTPSPSATPTATAVYKPAGATGRAQNVPVPVLPEAAKAETKEGLEAFVSYWYSTLSYAYETGDTKPLESASGPACGACAKVKTEVTEWHADGRWMAGGKMHVEGVHSDFVETSPAEYQAVVQVYQDTTDYYLADATLKGSVPRKPAIGDIVIALFDGSGWKAHTVEHLVK